MVEVITVNSEDVFVYFEDLPDGINEMVTPCLDGYTVYIDRKLTYEQRLKAVDHAIRHVKNLDFEREDVQMVEVCAHKT